MTEPNKSEEELKKLKNEEKKKAKAEEKAAKAAKVAQKKAKMAEEEKKAEAKRAIQPKEEKELRLKKEYVNSTPAGEKKDMTQPMEKTYDPPAVEAAWYTWWEKCGFFTPEYGNPSPSNEKFIIVIPPPNVTGSLHLGHALCNSIQDALVRWHRMLGHTTLWVPGVDHAGIATQSVVEKRLWKDKKITRHDLGREPFIKEVFQWKDEYGARIVNQLKRLGSSLDWNREVFTMDDKLSRAVIEAFVLMYDQGLLYRATRLVNWCSALNTAISDIEVDYEDLDGITKLAVPGHGDKKYEFGAIWEFAYKVADSDDELVVATTRPETMLADTAVAIHPDDARYKHLHGKFVVHPFHQTKIPIVLDSVLVDMSFGTGAVKVTPAHDPNDYEVGLRHKLPMPELFTDEGRIGPFGGKEFEGMMRFDARDKVIKRLADLGLYKGIKPNAMRLGICSRSKDVIEPRLKPQWWVSCSTLATAAKKAEESGEMKLSPASEAKTWHRWMDGIRDWCISRQLWWGHRIPAYLASVQGKPRPDPLVQSNWFVGRNEAEARKKAAASLGVKEEEVVLEQDPDVLDTWFSSGLFPFSVFGWPDQTPDLSNFYPNTLLETGSDIIFFWVARMVFMGQALTGKVPFKEVLLHALVRDAHGRKMSKALGNVIDPIDVIEGITLEKLQEGLEKGNLPAAEIAKAKAGQAQDFPKGISECGTDALRFALCAYMAQGRDINLDIKRVEAYRAFCNKIWNATKFAMMKLELFPGFVPAQPNPAHQHKIDKWMFSRMADAVEQVNTGLQTYSFSKATTAIYNYWLYDLCDNYLEMIKTVLPNIHSDENNNNANKVVPPLTDEQQACLQTLYASLETGLKLLHPFMPFLTEELYQRLPRRTGDNIPSIMVSSFPLSKDVSHLRSEGLEEEVRQAQDVIKAIRSLLASYGIPPSKKPAVYITCNSVAAREVLVPFHNMICSLSFAGSLEIYFGQVPPAECAMNVVNTQMDVHVDLRGMIDFKAEITRLQAKHASISQLRDTLLKKVNAPTYSSKVPAQVQSENSTKLESYEQELQATQAAINKFSSLAG